MRTGIAKFNQKLEETFEESKNISYLKFYDSAFPSKAKFELSLAASGRSKICVDKICFYDSKLKKVLGTCDPIQNSKRFGIIQNIVFEEITPKEKRLHEKSNLALSLENGIYVKVQSRKEFYNLKVKYKHLYIDIHAIDGYDNNFHETCEISRSSDPYVKLKEGQLEVNIGFDFSINSNIFMTFPVKKDIICNGNENIKYIKEQIEDCQQKVFEQLDKLAKSKSKDSKNTQKILRDYQKLSIKSKDSNNNYGVPFYSLEEIQEVYPSIDSETLNTIKEDLKFI